MLTTRTTEKMGWRPDLPDVRDYTYDRIDTKPQIKSTTSEALPERYLIDPKKLPPVFDQGPLGSCVANAIGTMFSYVRRVAPRSRLQIYYEARRLINETHLDEGAYIRDGMKVVSQLGAGRESWWPYDVTKFNVDPPLTVDRDALKRRIFAYYRLMNGVDYRKCLTEGFPFVIGFTVYDNFLTAHMAKMGILRYPSQNERPRGGHAVMVYGYDSNFPESSWAKEAVSKGYPVAYLPKEVYYVRNSWGKDWGRSGDFVVDTRYFDNAMLADDAWTIRKK